MRHIMSILLQNEAGALARVASLFATRGYNIESLSVAPTEDVQISRLTLVTLGSDQVIGQINNQLYKLVDVVETVNMTVGDHIERELLLLKLRIGPDGLEDVQALGQEAGAAVLDEQRESYTLELTGTGQQIDQFIQQMARCGEILAVVRSGPLAVARGMPVLAATG